jgi:sec-independent protein translocase protein TatA
MGLDNPLHIAFLVIILLLVFGARRLPEIGRSLGGGMREFKDSISGETKHSTLTPTIQQQPQAPVTQPAPPLAAEPAPPVAAPVPPVAAPVPPVAAPGSQNIGDSVSGPSREAMS